MGYRGSNVDIDTQNRMINEAYKLAYRAHTGQVDLAGVPYMVHICNVANSIINNKGSFIQIMLGILHDVLKDTEFTPDDIITDLYYSYGIDNDVLYEELNEIIRHYLPIITRERNESYDSYIKNIGKYPEVIPVKLADIEDNLRVERLSSFSDRDAKRCRKYLVSREYLGSVLKTGDSGSIRCRLLLDTLKLKN